MITITRTPWVDEVPDVAPGTVLNNATKTELYDQIDEALAVVDEAIAAVDPGGPGGSGTVTHTAGALTVGRLVVGNGAADLAVLASLGSATTVLHGNAAGLPAFGPVSLATDVSGTLLAAQEPAHTGDVTNAAGSLALAIGAGKVTNAMLAGAIAASKLVGSDLSLAESQVVNLVGDLAALVAAVAAETAARSAADALLAPLASPTLTGVPAAPTAGAATNTTQLATTAFVQAAVAALVASAPGTLDTLNELAAALGNDPSFATTLATSLGLKAPLASPTLTGTPAAPTAAPGTNTTQLATTAFSAAAVAVETAARVAADALLAPLASPALTGTPTAPTAAAVTSTTQLATTAFVRTPVVQTTTLTGAQNNFALSAGCALLRCNNATLLTLTGLVAGVDGQLLVIESMGAGQVDLSPQDASSTAANRLQNFATSGKASLAPGVGNAVYQYDATAARWRMVSHVQGAVIAVAWNAANFTAASGTWTVEVGDQTVFTYLLIGKMLTVTVNFYTTSNSASTAYLAVVIPGGFLSGNPMTINIFTGLALTQTGGLTVVYFYQPALVAWPISTNTCQVAGTFTIEVV